MTSCQNLDSHTYQSSLLDQLVSILRSRTTLRVVVFTYCATYGYMKRIYFMGKQPVYQIIQPIAQTINALVHGTVGYTCAYIMYPCIPDNWKVTCSVIFGAMTLNRMRVAYNKMIRRADRIQPMIRPQVRCMQHEFRGNIMSRVSRAIIFDINDDFCTLNTIELYALVVAGIVWATR
jgi:hypothetical protein